MPGGGFEQPTRGFSVDGIVANIVQTLTISFIYTKFAL